MHPEIGLQSKALRGNRIQTTEAGEDIVEINEQGTLHGFTRRLNQVQLLVRLRLSASCSCCAANLLALLFFSLVRFISFHLSAGSSRR